jgi:DNA-binding MarR family transcriptional regulator
MTPNDNISIMIPHLFEAYRIASRHALNANQLGLNAMYVKCVILISKTPNCTANDICTVLNRDKAQIARLIKEMILKGWIEKQPSQVDKRSYIITLTAVGLTLNEQIKQAKETVLSQMMIDLTKEDIAIFRRISEQIVNNLTDASINSCKVAPPYLK